MAQKRPQKLVSARQWRDRTFTGDRLPDMDTVRRWIRDGKIDGRIIGSSHFVVDDERGSAGNALVDMVLSED